jgi:MFS transporter, MHS family, shikimate and dehydroshikimate transport protein
VGTTSRLLLLFAVGEFVAIPLFAALSDRVGRRPVFIASAAFTMIYAFPAFWLVGTTVPPLIWLAVGLGGVRVGALYGITGAFASELFGTEVRYSGASLGYQLSAAIAGGLTPFVATAMVAAAGGYWPVPAYLAALGIISLLSTYLASKTYRSDLSGQATVAERRVATSEPR